LALKSADELGSCRQIRALLIKGANPMIRDDKGKIALDYVDDIASDYLQHEAREILV
jgi:hypothetical protein